MNPNPLFSCRIFLVTKVLLNYSPVFHKTWDLWAEHLSEEPALRESIQEGRTCFKSCSCWGAGELVPAKCKQCRSLLSTLTKSENCLLSSEEPVDSASHSCGTHLCLVRYRDGSCIVLCRCGAGRISHPSKERALPQPVSPPFGKKAASGHFNHWGRPVR